MNGLDLVVLSILSTTVIVVIGCAVKACQILKKDWNRGHSLVEVKPLSHSLKKRLFLSFLGR